MPPTRGREGGFNPLVVVGEGKVDAPTEMTETARVEDAVAGETERAIQGDKMSGKSQA